MITKKIIMFIPKKSHERKNMIRQQLMGLTFPGGKNCAILVFSLLSSLQQDHTAARTRKKSLKGTPHESVCGVNRSHKGRSKAVGVWRQILRVSRGEGPLRKKGPRLPSIRRGLCQLLISYRKERGKRNNLFPSENLLLLLLLRDNKVTPANLLWQYRYFSVVFCPTQNTLLLFLLAFSFV